jgi:hypothetical protein
MKTIIVLLIATIFFIACNDPKDPPDEGMTKMAQAHADSIKASEILIIEGDGDGDDDADKWYIDSLNKQ